MDESNCEKKGCKLFKYDILACRWNPREYNFIMGLIQTPPVLIMTIAFAVIGVLTGNWWSMAIYAWIAIIWPLGLETFVLCRHCPYYADSGKTLTCWALRYMPKWWKYDPRPCNKAEKFFVKYFLFIIPTFIWPAGWMLYGIRHVVIHYPTMGLAALLGMIGLAFAVIVSMAQFFFVLLANNCPRCVNFSCPLNKVPVKVVNEYLELNPIMKEAWIKHGYKLDSQLER